MNSALRLHKGAAPAWGEYVRQLIAAQSSEGSVRNHRVKNACAQWETNVALWHPETAGAWVHNADGTRDYKLGPTLFVAGASTKFNE